MKNMELLWYKKLLTDIRDLEVKNSDGDRQKMKI